jgi:hypothetical protein
MGAAMTNRRTATQLIESSLTTGLDVIVPWTAKLADDLRVRCPREKALITDEQITFARRTKKGAGWRVILEQNLGETQQYMLRALREHGWWARNRCGWIWNTTSGTIKLLEALRAHWLVDLCSSQQHPAGVYRPVLYDAEGRRIRQ